MADILQQLTIRAPRSRVFEMFATPQGLDRWWTKTATGTPKEGAEYTLFFGPEHDWRAKATRCSPISEFELLMTHAHPDWVGTRVGCQLQAQIPFVTCVRFYHTGWPEPNEHWRISCHCWAMYLRVLRRFLEHSERVPYEKRLEV
jgi:uncharacterized protein YndB with AHSA1/START domain